MDYDELMWRWKMEKLYGKYDNNNDFYCVILNV